MSLAIHLQKSFHQGYSHKMLHCFDWGGGGVNLSFCWLNFYTAVLGNVVEVN